MIHTCLLKQKMSNADSSIRTRYETALKQNPIPTRIMLPNAHFVSNVLPRRTSSTTRRLKQLQKMYTANEFSHYTKGFKNRQLNLRTGLPSGRGVSKSKKKKKTTKRKQRLENNVVRMVKGLSMVQKKKKKKKKKTVKKNKK